MSPFVHLVDGLFGLTALSSFAGFVFQLLTGNPDVALLYLFGIGGSAAMVWIVNTWRQNSLSAPAIRPVAALVRRD
jgi:hypothetical protein